MSDKKVSQLQRLVNPSANDLLLVIDMKSEIPVSKNITIGELVGQLPAITTDTLTIGESLVVTTGNNASINATVPLTANTVTAKQTSTEELILTDVLTPAQSADTQLDFGRIFFDENYLYIKVNNTEIKRVALETF
ncbi:hypothetical protein phiOC_p402 [Ochrobactrum phage vB_OspM_OC]|nr:hypothetical protein phiOC_p402 [Ochrobactrum phage vB_OspM_OC]